MWRRSKRKCRPPDTEYNYWALSVRAVRCSHDSLFVVGGEWREGPRV